jgi:uncharacterized membrane protein YoaK (UPF0700 family)
VTEIAATPDADRASSRWRRGVALALLSFAAGTMDAIAFLALGEVFTSAMSGNTILFGIALGQGNLAAASRAMAAFAGYVCGVAGAAVTLREPERGIRRAIGLEVLLLAAFAGWWIVRDGAHLPSHPHGLIVVSAVAMGLQGAIGRALRISGIPTIVITSTLTAIVGGLGERALARERPLVSAAARQQIAAYLAYLLSAVVAGIAVWSGWLVAVPFAPLAAVFALWLGLRLGLVELRPG